MEEVFKYDMAVSKFGFAFTGMPARIRLFGLLFTAFLVIGAACVATAEPSSVSAITSEGRGQVSGRVVDNESGEPLAFVNIVIEGTRSGGMTDIDGFFSITHSRPVETLLLSYVGYDPAVFEVPEGVEELVIAMDRKAVELAEVVVYPGENPAHRIIQNVMNNRAANHPEKRGGFSYNAYNKFVFTGAFDVAEGQPLTADSMTVRLNSLLEDHHFFMMETVTERRFMPPGRDNEVILASRVSGFENPIFALLFTQIQSFSFYNDHIEISGSRFLSPLAPGSLNRYFFLLEDTTFTNRDTVFVVSYRPGLNRNFEGLKGLLYVNTNGWALQNVIAGPAGENGNARIKIQQKYEQVDGRQWFPTQLHTDFEILNVNNLNDFRVLGHGRTYLQNIMLDVPLRRRDFSPFQVEFSPETLVDDEGYWERFRADTLTRRERNTYSRLDSIGRERDLDGQIERFEALFSGALRKGWVDVGIPELIGYNEVEGLRLGLSLQTNRSFSKRFGFSSALAYGFRDQRFKYGVGGHVVLDRLSDLRLGFGLKRDVEERGGSEFLEARSLLSPQVLRRFFLRTMDMSDRRDIWLGGRTWRNFLSVKAYAAIEKVQLMGDYRFAPFSVSGEPETIYFFETGARLRLAYGEKFLLTPDRILAFSENVPVFHLNIARGWKGPFDGAFDYWRLEAMFQKTFAVRMMGNQRFTIRAGWVDGAVPWTRLFSAPASYRLFSLSVPRSFSTMRMDEFVSDQYVALFWQHHFGNLLYRSKRFNPGLVVLTNVGFGRLNNPHHHHHVTLSSMDKGYFESGVAFLDLMGSGFSKLGLELMVRYGPYARPEFKDNLSVRLAYSLLF